MKFFKFTSLVLVAFFAISFANAQEKPKSPAAKATGTINGAKIEINYFSPSVRDRVIWGELVPFGQVWRAGANDATTFETDKELTIEGSKLPAGKYSFFVIPNENECIIIFNKVVKQWGAYKYKESEDQLRVKVSQEFADTNVEKLVYSVNANGIVLSWDNWNIGVNIK
jgi:hypothetical protein